VKKTILILVAYYLPGFKAGGPIRSISGLVEGLSDEYDFKIICGDRDLGDKRPFANLPAGLWHEYGAARVLRIPPGPAGAIRMLRAISSTSYDILYLNSIWSRVYSILPIVLRKSGLLLKMPIVLAPRGELSTGALRIKPRQKRLYLILARKAKLFAGILWQASSQAEKIDIMNSLGNVDVREAASIAAASPGNSKLCGTYEEVSGSLDSSVVSGPVEALGGRVSKVVGELRVVTLGRVCLMKNIEFAIGLFKGIRGRVIYDLYGPLEDENYMAKCERQCAYLPDGVTVRFMGGIPHDAVHETLSKYHLFLLPTLGENYGHVISEAMRAGCVALISDRTPWRNLEDAHSGWDLPLSSQDAFEAAIQNALAWTDEEFRQLSCNALSFVKNHTLTRDAIRANRLLFETALNTCSATMIERSKVVVRQKR
jgi:glycosyltransferase involved in cell wall biosynthesis